MFRVLKNSKGQMTIFVALIFQVLFVLFAMSINIGLLIHDKINLQNSVDFGAYYGAQKMAEVMNGMAHINYQIRQDWKLLTFRVRALGSMGFDANTRVRRGLPTEAPIPDVNIAALAPVCNGHRTWAEVRGDNLCQRIDFTVSVPPNIIFNNLDPFNAALSRFVERQRQQIADDCNKKSELNWRYASGSFFAYRMSVAKRKNAFKALALNLSQPMAQVRDLDGDLIQSGMQSTILNNLTHANRDSIEQLEYFNGLAGPITTDTPPWLSEILIAPQIFWIEHRAVPGDCRNRVNHIRDPGIAPVDRNTGVFLFSQGEPNTSTLHSSMGFEKNPWIMAYVGVKATASPRKPFAPFGSPVRIVARSFAKPFGGRMGPWFKSSWAQGSPNSGVGQSETDPLLPPRIPAAGQVPDITGNPLNLVAYVPNFSKYPGDQVGLKSDLGQSLPLPVRTGSMRAFDLFNRFPNLGQPDGDAVSLNVDLLNQAGNSGGVARNLELYGISPDLFDATYYSIDPNYNRLYSERRIWQSIQSPNGQALVVPTDLGSLNQFNQTTSARAQVEFGGEAARRGPFFFKLSSPEHLLTSWHQRRESDFTLDPERFGRCYLPVPNNPQAPPMPGSCISGGRTGYSVKLISKNYLFYSNHQIGGASGGGGAIQNPPPVDF